MESGEACAGCPWDEEVSEPIIYKLMDYLSLQHAGCPIGRHELTNDEWKCLGTIKGEFERLEMEDAKKKAQ
ncbi:MAG: hypothetical protein PHS64_00285 [Candidatus Omnitrophica bacterium]|nr:hypothetical protein [Candidatus Omnitrophota bacterium]